MEEIRKNNNFEIISIELESQDSQEVLQIVKGIKVIVNQVEEQKSALEEISAISTDINQMYLSTGT